jgi:hypothetical protein
LPKAENEYNIIAKYTMQVTLPIQTVPIMLRQESALPTVAIWQ